MKRNKLAFSLMELSIVILIIGILVAGITASSNLIDKMKMVSARSLSQSSPVSSITNLALWLDATAENGVATGTSSFTNVDQPTSGTAIGRWNDVNPLLMEKNHAIQSNSSYQPTYVTNSLNGLPGIKFDGTADTLVSPLNIYYANAPSITIFAVFRRLGSNGQTLQKIMQCCVGQGYARQIIVDRTSSSPGLSTGSSIVGVTGLNSLNPMVFSAVLQQGVVNGSSVFINGGSAVTTFTENHSNSTTGTSLGVGGASGTQSESFNGTIHEFIVYDRALKAEERQAVESYLRKKWGI